MNTDNCPDCGTPCSLTSSSPEYDNFGCSCGCIWSVDSETGETEILEYGKDNDN